MALSQVTSKLTGAFLSIGLMINFLSLKEIFLISLQGNPIFGVSLDTKRNIQLIISIVKQKHKWNLGPRNAVGTLAASVFHSSFEFSQTFMLFLQLNRNTENLFFISFKNAATKKRKKLVYHDYQNVNCLCKCYAIAQQLYVCVSNVSSVYKQTIVRIL